MKTKIYTWAELEAFLDANYGKDLIQTIGKFKTAFNLSDQEANTYMLFYMGYSN